MTNRENEPEENLTRAEIELDKETIEHYEARAAAAGRTLNDQIIYELNVHRGLVEPDPGDLEAEWSRRVFSRLLGHRPPLMG